MPFSAALVMGGTQLIGGMMAADSARDAAQTSANAQLETSRMAAEQAKFTPFGIAGSLFAQPKYSVDAEGRPTVDLGINPEFRAYQNRLMGLAGGGLTQAEQAGQQYAPLSGAATGLFNLGQKYLAQTPEEVAQQYMIKQQDLLAPTRERQLAELRNRGFQTGREGLSVGGTGLRPGGGLGLSATNPEMEAYYNALAQQDAALAAQAQQAGQQQVAFGTGLFGQGANLLNQYQTGQVGALSPFQAYLAATQGIESLGQAPLDIGAQLGGRAATAGAQAGQSLLYGGTNAARTMQPANALNPFARTIGNLAESREFTTGLGNLFGGQQYTPQQFQQQQAATYGSGNAGFGGYGGFFD